MFDQAFKENHPEILTRYKVEQQGFRACMALLKLSDQYSPQRLESACAMGLDYTSQPSYKSHPDDFEVRQGQDCC